MLCRDAWDTDLPGYPNTLETEYRIWSGQILDMLFFYYINTKGLQQS